MKLDSCGSEIAMIVYFFRVISAKGRELSGKALPEEEFVSSKWVEQNPALQVGVACTVLL